MFCYQNFKPYIVIMENTTPKKFENVKVYLGDPWHEASSFAKVRGLKFWSSPEDTHPSKCKNEIDGNFCANLAFI